MPSGPGGVTLGLEGWSEQGRMCGITQLWFSAGLDKKGECSRGVGSAGFTVQSKCLKLRGGDLCRSA